MMKRYDKKKLLLYIFIILIVCILKKPYLPEIIDDYSHIPFNILAFNSKNSYINFVWIIPIISSTFILTSSLYYKLINFDTRFKNRKRYLFECLKENFVQSIWFAMITILMQWFIFMFTFKFTIQINEMVFLIIIKYMLETYLLSSSILFLSLLIDNFIYSYTIVISSVIILINSFKFSFVPFVNLYCNYNINISDALLIIILILFMNFIYRKKDLGGAKYETSS